MRLTLPILALPLLLAGCVNTDPTVFVEPSLVDVTATVKGGALGATLSGAMTLQLHLGPRASGPAQVTLGAFSILDAKQSAEITALTLGASSVDFPLTVAPDSDVSAKFAFDLGSKTISADDAAKLCVTAGVVVRGTIQDSLVGGSTPFFSDVVHPTGCP